MEKYKKVPNHQPASCLGHAQYLSNFNNEIGVEKALHRINIHVGSVKSPWKANGHPMVYYFRFQYKIVSVLPIIAPGSPSFTHS